MKKYLYLWFPVVFWCLVIFYFSSLQTNVIDAPFNLTDFIIKKTAHIIEYAILTVLFFRALYKSLTTPNLNQTAFYTFLYAFFYAISDEFHQMFTYGRTARVRDVIIDIIGISLALYFISKLKTEKNFLKDFKIKNQIKKFIFN